MNKEDACTGTYLAFYDDQQNNTTGTVCLYMHDLCNCKRQHAQNIIITILLV